MNGDVFLALQSVLLYIAWTLNAGLRGRTS